MNHPYSGAAGYIYANEYDDEVYTTVKTVFPIVGDTFHPTPTQIPSTTQTNLPRSLPSSMILGSPDSRNTHLSLPSRKRTVIQDMSKGPTSSFDRSDGRYKADGHRFEATWNSNREPYYESRSNRTLAPQSSFVDLREQGIFHIDRGIPGQRKARSWRRSLQRRMHDALQALRKLWTRGP